MQEIIDEYSEEEHPVVWHCRLELRISYDHLLTFHSNQKKDIEFIERELLKFFIHFGWKLLDKVPSNYSIYKYVAYCVYKT
jgi:hypothetical protein